MVFYNIEVAKLLSWTVCLWSIFRKNIWVYIPTIYGQTGIKATVNFCYVRSRLSITVICKNTATCLLRFMSTAVGKKLNICNREMISLFLGRLGEICTGSCTQFS